MNSTKLTHRSYKRNCLPTKKRCRHVSKAASIWCTNNINGTTTRKIRNNPVLKLVQIIYTYKLPLAASFTGRVKRLAATGYKMQMPMATGLFPTVSVKQSTLTMNQHVLNNLVSTDHAILLSSHNAQPNDKQTLLYKEECHKIMVIASKIRKFL